MWHDGDRAKAERGHYVKGVTVMVNSFFTGYRYEDVWLDK